MISNSIFINYPMDNHFQSILNQQGYQVTKENTKFEYITLNPQDDLFQYYGRQCLKISRCYYLDGEPYIHFTHYLPGDIQVPDQQKLNDFSLYMYLYQHNHSVADFNDDFFVEFPPLDILKALHLENGPVLGRKRISHDIYGKVVEVSHARYNTRIHNYQIQYKI